MRNILTVLVLISAGLAAVGAQAAGDNERGAMLANTCLGCHGIDGYRNAYPSYRVPKLGGQHEEYIVTALQGYKNHTRSHPTMLAQAGSLSDEDIRAVAAFFSSQGEPRTSELKAGGRIARGEKKAAVCTACHGQGGLSTTPNWPILAGQHRDYLEQALGQYQGGGRKDPVMVGQAAALSEQDIKDIAAYFSAQSGLFTAGYNN